MEGSAGGRGNNACGAAVGTAGRGKAKAEALWTKTIFTADVHPACGQVAR